MSYWIIKLEKNKKKEEIIKSYYFESTKMECSNKDCPIRLDSPN
jgi:hypothetical protein